MLPLSIAALSSGATYYYTGTVVPSLTAGVIAYVFSQTLLAPQKKAPLPPIPLAHPILAAPKASGASKMFLIKNLKALLTEPLYKQDFQKYLDTKTPLVSEEDLKNFPKHLDSLKAQGTSAERKLLVEETLFFFSKVWESKIKDLEANPPLTTEKEKELRQANEIFIHIQTAQRDYSDSLLAEMIGKFESFKKQFPEFKSEIDQLIAQGEFTQPYFLKDPHEFGKILDSIVKTTTQREKATAFFDALHTMWKSNHELLSTCSTSPNFKSKPEELKSQIESVLAQNTSMLTLIKGNLASLGRSRKHRVIKDPDAVSRKLTQELTYARCAKEAEDRAGPKSFIYQKYESSLACTSETAQVEDYSVAVCHAQGRRKTMEDEHLATSFNLRIGSKNYPVQLFGVFDGHGGPEASKYVKKNLERVLIEKLKEHNTKDLTDLGIWNALKLTCTSLHDQLRPLGIKSGTTATFAMILNHQLWTANVGDARTILESKEGEIIQLSEDAKPDDPRYKKSIEKRGNTVSDVKGTARIDETLAVARSIGDHSLRELNPRAKITKTDVSNIKPESHLILACDGIWDVATTTQIGTSVKTRSETSVEDLAKDIVYSAYSAGSGDNLTTLIVRFPDRSMLGRAKRFFGLV